MKSDTAYADWQPDLYLKFAEFRTRPVHDLLQRISLTQPRRIIDLGCGPGNSTAALRARWPEAEVVGVDSSETMLAKAREALPEVTFLKRDLTGDLSDLGQFDLAFSNAVLQWIPDLESLIPQIFALLHSGGVLAFQIPQAEQLGSHRVMDELVRRPDWARYFTQPVARPIYRYASCYYDMLSRHCAAIDLWETLYIQAMPDHAAIVEWNRASALRNFLDALPEEPRARFLEAYEAGIRDAYEVQKNGAVLYPFLRVFGVARKG